MKDKQDLKAMYDKLKVKFKLPEYSRLNEEFEIGDVEKKEFLLRAVRRKMRDKLIFFCRILEGVLYPTDRSPLNAYESSFFDDSTKTHLSQIHRTMMIFDRQSLLLDIQDSDEQNVEFILALWKEWSLFGKEISAAIKIMEKSWKSTGEEKGAQGYFG